MPDIRKDKFNNILPVKEPALEECDQSGEDKAPDESPESKIPVRGPRNFVPIIMSFALFLIVLSTGLSAQAQIDISLGTTYSDNAFQLSEYDLQRFNENHPNLAYVDTSDDLNLAAGVTVAYPVRYRWWKFTPSVTAKVSQNISNEDKYRSDALMRVRVDRYYWNFTALYGYYPYNYVRSYIDSDGTGKLEKYGYERNLYRGDLSLKPLKNTTVHLSARYDEYFYNQYWTEFDGNATTWIIGLRHSFPAFSLSGEYEYRIFDNTNHSDEDSSYESNIYIGELALKSMPLSENKPDGPAWHPSLALSYEQRYFQSNDPWYGGRVYYIYGLDAAMNFDLDDRWNILLDYSHTFRNVESPVSAVRRAREYGENRFSATVNYSF